MRTRSALRCARCPAAALVPHALVVVTNFPLPRPPPLPSPPHSVPPPPPPSPRTHAPTMATFMLLLYSIWVPGVRCARVAPASARSGDHGRSGSLGAHRRAALDISPESAAALADCVAALEAGALRASLDGTRSTTQAEVEQLYADITLIHRGRYGGC